MSWSPSTRTLTWSNAGPTGTYYMKFWVTNGSVDGGSQNGAMDAIIAQITVTSSGASRSGALTSAPNAKGIQLLTPNPTRGELAFLTSGAHGTATLEVFDVRGRLIAHVRRDHGHEIKWDGRDRLGKAASPGVYVYRVRVGPSVWDGRVVVLR